MALNRQNSSIIELPGCSTKKVPPMIAVRIFSAVVLWDWWGMVRRWVERWGIIYIHVIYMLPKLTAQLCNVICIYLCNNIFDFGKNTFSASHSWIPFGCSMKLISSEHPLLVNIGFFGMFQHLWRPMLNSMLQTIPGIGQVKNWGSSRCPTSAINFFRLKMNMVKPIPIWLGCMFMTWPRCQ